MIAANTPTRPTRHRDRGATGVMRDKADDGRLRLCRRGRSGRLHCRQRGEAGVLVLVIVLLVLWFIVAVVGFAFKELIWLALVGIILFVGTAAIGFVRRKDLGR
jgi:hypothetical protein